MTLITDRSTKPEGFACPLGCLLNIRVPSTFVVTGPTFPTCNVISTKVPRSMHHLGRTMTMSPIPGYSPIQRRYPRYMTVSNTTTLVTDRGAKPNGFPSPFRCVFTFLTNPTFPTRDLVVTEVPIGMHHLGMNPITITIIMITDYNPIGHP